jgi:hypothetical protein
MNRPINWACLLLLAAGLAWFAANLFRGAAERVAVAKDGPTSVDDLKTQIESLKKLLPDQAHAMTGVGYHFSNLWFAGDSGNWPLADFYFKETRSNLQWAVRIKPIRQDNAKQNIDLVKILEALQNSPLKQLEQAIAEKSTDKFVAAYKITLEGCYACHKASDKPYLRPHIPSKPESQMINPDPKAQWPL